MKRPFLLLALVAFVPPSAVAGSWACLFGDTHKHYFCDGKAEVEKFQRVAKGSEADCIRFCSDTAQPGGCNLVNGEICSFVSIADCERAGGQFRGKDDTAPIRSGICDLRDRLEKLSGIDLSKLQQSAVHMDFTSPRTVTVAGATTCAFTERDEDYDCAGNSGALDILEIAPGNAGACLAFCSAKKKAGQCSLVKTKMCLFIDAEKCAAGGGKLKHAKKEGGAIETGTCREGAAVQMKVDAPANPWGRPANPEEFQYLTYTYKAAKLPIPRSSLSQLNDVVLTIHPNGNSSDVTLTSDLTCRVVDDAGTEHGRDFVRVSIPARLEGSYVTVLQVVPQTTTVMIASVGGTLKCGYALPAFKMEARTDGTEFRLYSPEREFFTTKP
jgi:hypothetical protein